MTRPPETLDLPVLPLRDVVVFPHMVIPLFVGRDKSIRALDQAMEADKRILLVAQKSAETDDPGAQGPVRDRHAGAGAAVAEAARRHDQGAGRRRVARARRPTSAKRDGALSGTRRRWSNPSRLARSARSRSDGALADVACSSSTSRPTASCRRNCCRRSAASTIPAAWPTPSPRTWACAWPTSSSCWKRIDIGDAPGIAGRLRRRRDRRAAAGEAHPRPGEVADGEEPARVLPQRADEGDPEGTGRDRRSAQRPGRTGPQDRRSRHAQAGRSQGQAPNSTSSSRCRRCRPKPRSCATTSTGCSACRGRSAPRSARTSRPRRTCSTPTTTAWRRSRNASSNTSRCRRA